MWQPRSAYDLTIIFKLGDNIKLQNSKKSITCAICSQTIKVKIVINAIFFISGALLSALFLLMCAYYGDTTKWAIAFLSLSLACSGFGTAGAVVNNLDIAPKYAGILFGIANIMASIPGFVGPQVAKAIAKKVSV